jgi:hypothetical protein
MSKNNSEKLILLALIFFTVFVIFLKSGVAHGKVVLVVGDNPVNEEVVLSGTGNTFLGDIVVKNQGKLILHNNAEMQLKGNLYLLDSSQFRIKAGAKFFLEGEGTHLIMTNNSHLLSTYGELNYVMTYLHQHMVQLYDNAKLEMHNSRVTNKDGNQETYGSVRMFGTSTYIAKNMMFEQFRTFYIHGNENNATLETNTIVLENCNKVGDLLWYEAPHIKIKNSAYIILWMHFDQGAIVNTSFKQVNNVTRVIKNEGPGGEFQNIPWVVDLENCHGVNWGLDPYPGSFVRIYDTISPVELIIRLRFFGPGEQVVSSRVKNNTYYPYADPIIITNNNRYFRLDNTQVRWLKVDALDGVILKADDIRFSESVTFDTSESYLTNSTCEGQTVHLGVTDKAFVDFKNGEVWTYVSSWENSTLILRDSLVDWTIGEAEHGYTWQTQNIAHHNSRLYCLNTEFGYKYGPSESIPYAIDRALVMYADLNLQSIVAPEKQQGSRSETVKIYGSAWIDVGPESPVTFNRYDLYSQELYWPYATKLIARSTKEKRDELLGTWYTDGFSSSIYKIILVIYVNNDKGATHPTQNYPATRIVELKRKSGLQPR